MHVAPGGTHVYTPGLRFAAAAVLAQPGFTVERAVLGNPMALPGGYRTIEAHLDRIGRPITALCGLELRMPASLPPEGFAAFNDDYIARLGDWGLVVDGVPPLTRTNVCPRGERLHASGLLAFSYTVERDGRAPSFVVSGVADMPRGGRYPEDVIRRGESTSDALREKALGIIEQVNECVRELGVEWDSSASVHLYSLHDVAYTVVTELLPKVGVRPSHGVIWHDTAPPTVELELELDVRAYDREVFVPT
jgi:hypothetical protein